MRQHDAPGRPVLPCRPPTHLLPHILESCGGSQGELPWVRTIRAPVRAGQPCLDGGAGQPGGAGRCQSRPSRDCADDTQHVPFVVFRPQPSTVHANGEEHVVPGGMAGIPPRYHHKSHP